MDWPSHVVFARGTPGAFEDQQRLPSPCGMAAEPAVTLDPNEPEGAVSGGPGEWRMRGADDAESIDLGSSNLGPFDNLHPRRIARVIACQLPRDSWNAAAGFVSA